MMNKSNKFKTRLSDEEYIRIQRYVCDYLTSNGSISNQELRKISDITYDQAVFFFNKALQKDMLLKVGRGAGTRYMISANVASNN